MLGTLLKILSFLAIIGSLVWVGWTVVRRLDGNTEKSLPRTFLPPIAAFIISLLAFGCFSSSAYVSGTEQAVVENTVTGEFSVVGPGFHVFPLNTEVVPFMSKVTKYDMRQQRIEIGAPAEGQNRPSLAADSDSPGRPVVFIQASGWVAPNPDTLIELHREYGPKYADNWVEKQWVSTLKATQGTKPYNFIGSNREELAQEAEQALQAQLRFKETDLVFVSQTAIVNFDYEDRINQQLAEVSQKEFERQKKDEEIEIARREQEKQNVEADTRIQVAEKDAQAKTAAAEGEANAIRIQQEALRQAENDTAYLLLKWIEKWNGQVPQVQAGDDMTPLLNLPAPAQP